MKVMTLLGKRSEIIKLSLVIKVLDQHCEHTLVHTGQEADEILSDVHLRQLELRPPDIDLRATDGPGKREDRILEAVSAISPDRILASAIPSSDIEFASWIQDRGSRVFLFGTSGTVVQDAIVLAYSSYERETLLRRGADPDNVVVIGHPVREILDTFADDIESSDVLNGLSVRPFDYFLATVHRSENIKDRDSLGNLLQGLAEVSEKFGKAVLFAVHPRTAAQLEAFQLKPASGVRLLRALSFFDFVKLEKNALAVLTDSSSVQDECCILGVPNVTLGTSTDRPETIACGSNIIAGTRPDNIIRIVQLAIGQPASWTPPSEYQVSNISQTASRMILGEAFA